MESINVLTELSQKLAVAQRLTETLVFRTKDGTVYSVEIGESILPETQTQVGAKVSQLSPTAKHIGIVQAESRASVIEEAQKMIVLAIESGSAIPSPHIKMSGKAIA